MSPRVVDRQVDLGRVSVHDTELDDVIDLRDITSPVYETCSALGLSLREGDLIAAERLFSFLVDQVPDRRLVLTDIVHPLIVSELNTCAPCDARLFMRTCRDLFVRLRRPPTQDDDGALLVAPDEGRDELVMHMIGLLLDDFAVPSTVFVEGDATALARRAQAGRETVACLAVDESLTAEEARGLASSVRQLRTVALLTGPRSQDSQLRSCFGTAAAGIGEAVDALLQMRGPLTVAEATALRLAADGYTNVRMAHELQLSVSAVKARLESGYSKLGAADRTHAVAIALRNRWIR